MGDQARGPADGGRVGRPYRNVVRVEGNERAGVGGRRKRGLRRAGGGGARKVRKRAYTLEHVNGRVATYREHQQPDFEWTQGRGEAAVARQLDNCLDVMFREP